MKKEHKKTDNISIKNKFSLKSLRKPLLAVFIIGFICFSIFSISKYFPKGSQDMNSTNNKVIATKQIPTITNNAIKKQTESYTGIPLPKETESTSNNANPLHTESTIDANEIVFDDLKSDIYGYLDNPIDKSRYMLFTYDNERYLSDENFGIIKVNQNGKGALWYNKRTKSHFKNYSDSGYCKIFLCDGKWLYYTKRYSGGGSGEGGFDPNYGILGKVMLDGTKREEFPEIRMLAPTIYNDWIYFIRITDYLYYMPSYMFKVRKDGSNLTQVKTSKKCTIFDIQDDIIYYADNYGDGIKREDWSPKVSSLNLKTGKEIIDFISFEDYTKKNDKFMDYANGILIY